MSAFGDLSRAMDELEQGIAHLQRENDALRGMTRRAAREAEAAAMIATEYRRAIEADYDSLFDRISINTQGMKPETRQRYLNCEPLQRYHQLLMMDPGPRGRALLEIVDAVGVLLRARIATVEAVQNAPRYGHEGARERGEEIEAEAIETLAGKYWSLFNNE